MPPPPAKTMTQGTLASFFSKVPANGDKKKSVQPKPKPTGVPAAQLKSKISPPPTAASSSSQAAELLHSAIDEDDGDEPAVFLPAKKRIVSKAAVETSSQDVEMNLDAELDLEDEQSQSSRGRKLIKRRAIVDDSSSDEESKPLWNMSASDTKSVPSSVVSKSSNKFMPKKRARYSGDSDDEEFSMPSLATSEANTDDDFNEALDDDDEDVDASSSVSRREPKSKSKASKASRPTMPKKSSSNASGFSARLLTTAEQEKAAEKEENESRHVPWTFLKDVRDKDGNERGSPKYDPRTLHIPKSDWATMSPFEEQFWEIKQNHYDTVLFFQKGKFLELYEDDAWIGHQEFDLKITKRVKMSMAGVPETATDYWIAKFLARGYKVGRVDQVETALGAEMRRNEGTLTSTTSGGKSKSTKQKSARTIVRRELKSVLTSGTITDGVMLTDDATQTLLAIKETVDPESGLSTIGIVMLDASTAEFNVSQFTDDVCRTRLETIIRRNKPKEIVHERNGLSALTLRLIKNAVDELCVFTALKPVVEFLEEEPCRSELIRLFGGEEQIPKAIQSFWGQDEAIGALGGLVWYLKQLNLDRDLFTARNFNIYDPIRKGQTLQLDGQTLAHIEVLLNSQGTEEGTLLQLLSRTVTPFGKRLFRQWLCSPLQDVRAINDRLDAVEDIMKHPEFENQFESLSRACPDLERLISRIHAGSCSIKHFRQVIAAFHKVAKVLEGLRSVAADFESRGLVNLVNSAPDLGAMLEHVEGLFTGDGQELFPHDGKNERYDSASRELIGAEKALDQELEVARTLLKSDKVVYKDIGIKDIYQLEVPIKIKVPNTWTKVSSTQAVHRYYSPKSETLVKALKEARERKSMATKDFHLVVFEEFDKDYPNWLQAVKLVAQLDCLLSLAKASIALGEHACRPELFEHDSASIQFEELRHPCVIAGASGEGDFIPNDIKMGGEEVSMVLLTGPNMAGKSTLLRMTCVGVICAQLGCYVAARKAVISPVDRICTRMGATDAIFNASSTFKVEMDDARKILVESTPKSLVVLDELGRGTSTHDGHAIAFAVLHRLATHVQCLGFFATHYSSLGEDFAHHPNIGHRFMLTQVDEESKEVIFLFKVRTGSSPKSYGPHVAKMAGVPSDIVSRAISISEEFETKAKTHQQAIKCSERLTLSLQADTAWLLKTLTQYSQKSNDVMVIEGEGGEAHAKVKASEMLATMNMIRRAVKAMSI